MSEYRFLSHKIDKTMPEYGKEDVNLDNFLIKSIHKGDSCNVYSSTIHSHLGTHIDCPGHFFEHGKTVSKYPAKFWIFKHPFLLQKKLEENEIIKKEEFFTAPPETDIILIKSGFQKFRGQMKYNFSNPGIPAEAAFWLRENRPNIRAIGIDFISISSYQNRELGRKSHKAFLNPSGVNKPILIIEDMDLSEVSNTLSFVSILPLRVEFWDSSPCTIVGKVEE